MGDDYSSLTSKALILAASEASRAVECSGIRTLFEHAARPENLILQKYRFADYHSSEVGNISAHSLTTSNQFRS